MFGLALLCILFSTHTNSLLFGHKVVHIEKLAQCDDEQTPVELVSVLLNYQRSSEMTVNAEINFKRAVGGKINLHVELTKCDSKFEPDSCEYNSRHKFIVNCQQLFAKGKLWSDFVQHITNLPDKCPLPPAVYKVVDASISLDNMNRLPLEVGYWKIKQTGFAGKEKISCAMMELDIQWERRKTG